jgi:hypothetical protein
MVGIAVVGCAILMLFLFNLKYVVGRREGLV